MLTRARKGLLVALVHIGWETLQHIAKDLLCQKLSEGTDSDILFKHMKSKTANAGLSFWEEKRAKGTFYAILRKCNVLYQTL